MNPDTKEIFLTNGTSIYVGSRIGGSLALVASSFTFLGDIVVGNAASGIGLSVFAVDKTLNTVYEIATTLQSAVGALATSVRGLPLNAGQIQSLISKLNAVSASIASRNPSLACHQLGAFINAVNALAASNQLTSASASALVSAAQNLQASLGCA